MKKQLLTLAALLCAGSALAKINLTVTVAGETTETQSIALEEAGTLELRFGPHELDVKLDPTEDGIIYRFTKNDEERELTAAWGEELQIPCEGIDATVTFVVTEE